MQITHKHIKFNCSANIISPQTLKRRTSPEETLFGHLLVVEATAPAGGVAVSGEAVSEIVVQHVGQSPRDAFPGHDEDDDDGVGTVVAGTLPHQTQQLLLLAAAADHLTGQSTFTLGFTFPGGG